MTVTVYTTATQSADYGYCQSENTKLYEKGLWGRPDVMLRKVTLPLESLDYQSGRWGSCLARAYSEDEVREYKELGLFIEKG